MQKKIHIGEVHLLLIYLSCVSCTCSLDYNFKIFKLETAKEYTCMHISIKLAFLRSVEAFSRHLPYQIIDRSSGDVHIPSEK